MTSIQDRRKSRYSKKKIVSNDDLYKSNDPSVSIDSVKVPEQSIKIETAINKRPKRKNKKLVFVGGSNKMPVHPDLIELAQNGHSDAVKLMMKWGYEGSKKFIGGNPVEKLFNHLEI